MKASVAVLPLATLLLLSSIPAFAAAYTMSIKTNASSYAGASTIAISGVISPAPSGSNSAVVISTRGPTGVVDTGLANVATGTGAFSYVLVSGGSSIWVSGTYTVNGTWGSSNGTASSTTTFYYSAGAFSISLSTAQKFYSGTQVVLVSGTVSPGPTSGNTAVVLTTKNPTGSVVDIGTVPVGTGTGAFSYSFVTGGNTAWTVGNYTISTTYSASGSAASTATTGFYYGTSNLSPATLAASGIAAVNIAGYQGVQATYTSSYYQQLSVFVWLTARNSQGQTVGVFLGSATIGAAGSVTVFVPAFNLPPGSYTAQIFASTPSYIPLSTSSTVNLSV